MPRPPGTPDASAPGAPALGAPDSPVQTVVPQERARVPQLTYVRGSVRTLGISARCLLSSLTGEDPVKTADRLIPDWSKGLVRLCGTGLEVSGLENFPHGVTYVIMTNHCSHLDIPAVISTFPGQLRMIAKQELFHIPVFGQAMLATGFIPMNRSNREEAIRQLEIARSKLEKGTSIWISPEGTRSRDGKLGPLKKGGFRLALSLQVPILPARITGAFEVLPAGCFSPVQGGQVRVHYLPPISVAGHTLDTLPELMAQVEAALRG